MKLNRELFDRMHWCNLAEEVCEKFKILDKELTREMVEELLRKRVNFIQPLYIANSSISKDLVKQFSEFKTISTKRQDSSF